MIFKKKVDFLAIGDIVIDAFIELLDARVNCNINDNDCTITMRFGDKIPYKKATIVEGVGNSANAAVCATRLGLKTALVTHVGNDRNGEDCLASLKKNGVDTSLVEKQNGKDTNYHYILSYEAERTILVHHTEFDYSFYKKLTDFSPKWVYLSSLAKNSLNYHHEIYDYLKNNTDVKLAFQPGTFQIEFGYEKLQEIYQRSDLFFCNKEEANSILKDAGKIDKEETEIKVLLKNMLSLGPKIVVITDGRNGAYVYDGKNILFIPMYPDIATPIQRTGAGDAFASTLTSYLAMGMSMGDAMLRSQINPMSVVLHIGAQKGLLSREQIEEYLAKAPSNYKVSVME